MNNVAPKIPGMHVKGNVTHLLVEDNKAKVMFEAPYLDLGVVVWAFVVIDNGEGSSAPLDMVTFMWIAPVGSQAATDMYEMSVDDAIAEIGGLAPLYIGNAQVR